MTGFSEHHPDVLRTFLHLARQVECSSKHERGVSPSDLDLRVQPPYIDLSSGQSLLSDSQGSGHFGQFCAGQPNSCLDLTKTYDDRNICSDASCPATDTC
jgi:hypothetical protein